jgi:hypothetical protein
MGKRCKLDERRTAGSPKQQGASKAKLPSATAIAERRWGERPSFIQRPLSRGKLLRQRTMAVPVQRPKKRFTKENIKRQILRRAVSVKAHSLLGPILLPSHLLHLWAVAGTAAWAHAECNHWRARIGSSVPVSGYDVGPQHQATSIAAPQLESSGLITASYRGGIEARSAGF